ncbi:MAG: hypothetical protein MZV63_46280 [Marinilabiliales bacterium]|nr:hypothetical protein [Marinilabiliales bacterium]
MRTGNCRARSTVNTSRTRWLPAIPSPVNGSGHSRGKSDLQGTLNWTNWILGYKPERLFSSYLIAGFGVDQTIGHKVNTLTGVTDVHGSARKTSASITGNTNGIARPRPRVKVFRRDRLRLQHPQALEHPCRSPYWRLGGDDDLDMTKGGAKQVYNDMYSSVTLGLTYKFGYRSGCLCHHGKGLQLREV